MKYIDRVSFSEVGFSFHKFNLTTFPVIGCMYMWLLPVLSKSPVWYILTEKTDLLSFGKKIIIGRASVNSLHAISIMASKEIH